MYIFYVYDADKTILDFYVFYMYHEKHAYREKAITYNGN